MALSNYSDQIIAQAGRVGPTMSERLQPLAKGLGGAVSGAGDAINTFVLQNGAKAIDAGLKELQAAGLSNPALEQYFGTINPQDPEAVKSALDLMGQTLVPKAQAQEEGKKFVERGMTEAMSQLPEDATPYQRQRAQYEGAKNALVGAGKSATDAGYADTAARVKGMEAPKETAALSKANATMKKAALDTLKKDGGVSMIAPMKVAAETFNRVNAQYPDLWKFASYGTTARKIGNALNTFSEELKGQEGKQIPAETMLGQIKNFTNSLIIDAAQFTGTADKKKVDAFNEMMGQVGNMMASYIKALSGAAVTDNERAFLLGNLNLSNFASAEAFAQSANLLKQGTMENARNMEEMAQAYAGPEIWDTEILPYVTLPSSKFNEFSFDAGPATQQVRPPQEKKPPRDVPPHNPGAGQNGVIAPPPSGFTRLEKDAMGVPQAKSADGKRMYFRNGAWSA